MVTNADRLGPDLSGVHAVSLATATSTTLGGLAGLEPGFGAVLGHLPLSTRRSRSTAASLALPGGCGRRLAALSRALTGEGFDVIERLASRPCSSTAQF